ncbi:MAG: DUF6263 family protein [Planctomycetota bacterium]|nr:DUF6263 family protein [Planctomycetota bacterium]
MRRAMIGLSVLLFLAMVAIAADKKEYDLKLKFTKGEKLYYKCDTKGSRKSLNTNEESQETSIIEHEVNDVSEDGTSSLVMKILKIVQKSDKGEYDSEKGKKTVPKERADMLDSLLEKQLKAKVAPNGELKETEGEKEIAEEIIKGMGDNQMLKMMPREMVQKMIEETVKTSFGMLFFSFLPKEKVTVGKTWQFEQKQPLIKLIWEAKLKSVKKEKDKEIAEIEMTLKDVVLEAGDNPMMGGMVEVEKNYTGSGKAKFNISDGRTTLIEMNSQYGLKNKMTNASVSSQNTSLKAELLKEPPKIGK